MSCETANYLYNRCPETVSTNCISYQGEPIPCLGICKGMNLTVLETTVINKICDLATLTNMSAINFLKKCDWIKNAWYSAHPLTAQSEADKTILNILDFILDELCVLNTKVDDLPNPLDETYTYTYCAVCNTDCNPNVPLTIPGHIQKIIDCLCILNTKIDSYQTSINNANITAQNAVKTANDALTLISTYQDAITALSTRVNLQKDKINDIINAASVSLTSIANLPLLP